MHQKKITTMKTNLSSQIKLEVIPRRYYAPEGEIEKAALTREEKIYTRIFETMPEGSLYIAQHAVDLINRKIKEKGKCVIALGTGEDIIPVYSHLIEKYKNVFYKKSCRSIGRGLKTTFFYNI